MIASLESIFPHAVNEYLESHPTAREVKGRFKSIAYQYKISLDTGGAVQKQELYQYLVTAMFTDQVNWIRDRHHVRVIDENNAVDSLGVAEAADRAAILLSPK
jgi:hypothetical protein